jgi:hypothetical protein
VSTIIVPLLWRSSVESIGHYALTAAAGDQALDTNRFSVKRSKVETSDRNRAKQDFECGAIDHSTTSPQSAFARVESWSRALGRSVGGI